MRKFFSYIRNHFAEIYKIFLFLVTAFLIVMFLPKEASFKYEYQKGEPWRHDDLVAPIDFSIFKSEDELAKEKEVISNSLKPYFYRDVVVSKQASMKLRKELERVYVVDKEGLTDESNKKIDLLVFKFDSLFAKGIVNKYKLEEENMELNSIYIVEDNKAEVYFFTDLKNIREANDYFVDYMSSSKFKGDTSAIQIIQNNLNYNVFYDKKKSETELNSRLNEISPTRDLFLKGQLVIMNGQLIDAEKFQILESLKSEYEKGLTASSNYYSIVIGQSILVLISLLAFMLFVVLFRKDIFSNNKKLILILLLMLMMVFITSMIERYSPNLLYIVPVCLVPIIIRAFFDFRLALFVHVITISLLSFIAPNSFQFSFYQLVTGIISLVFVVQLQKRSQFFLSCLVIFMTYSLIYTGMVMIQEGSIMRVDWHYFMHFAISALLTLAAYPIIYILERIFGFITDVSLMELSDTNNKLLRKLSTDAPGTFHHCIQVANLAEEAAYVINANPLLTRTGALYHDVGKLHMPEYFTENQGQGENPHEDMSYSESASLIISHVIRGVEIAKKHKLPEQVIDFIRTHHGNKKAEYFYKMYRKENPNMDEKEEQMFAYSGPLPFSKETALVMMADAVEAASRSLRDPNSTSISKIVDAVINDQVAQSQFDNADISFRDVSVIKKVFKKRIMNIKHIRIEYPD